MSGPYILCPGGCGKKFISQAHAEAHADLEHKDWKLPKVPKRKGWVTPFGFVDFKEPVTYEEAVETSRLMHEFMKASTK
jgi:hypothetical protein